MNIEFFYQDCSFELKNKDEITKWVNECVAAEGRNGEDVNFIFCSDTYLLELNKKYLEHDYYTDVITFDYGMEFPGEDIVAGDVFISVDTVELNAGRFHVQFKSELHRVIIHGVLHLIGYNDKTDAEQAVMTEKEDLYLAKLTAKND